MIQLADRGSPGLDQLALARLIETARYDKHLRRMRAVYATRRAALAEALARHAPGVPLTGLAAGFHAVAHLPGTRQRTGRGVGGAAALDRPARHEPLRSDAAVSPPQLVLGFGNLSERTIVHGIAAISDLLRGES